MNPYESYLDDCRRKIDKFYGDDAHSKLAWSLPRRIVRGSIVRTLRALVPPGESVLDAGCGDGDILEALRPARGLGIDLCAKQIDAARRRASPGLEFRRMTMESSAQIDELFDHILLVNVLGEMVDIRTTLQQLRRLCKPTSRVILCTRSLPWWPVFALTQRLGLSRKSLKENWLSRSDVEMFIKLSDFEIVTQTRFFPLFAPGVDGGRSPLRWLASLPLLHRLGVYELTLLRPAAFPRVESKLSTSVVVPCKNEQDNIDELVRRIPDFGDGVEMIFVDDKSTDATAAKIRENIKSHPEKTIRLVDGPGQGKGAAVRAGFAQAKGDVYMILDADMSVAPEALPEFHESLASQKGDFINGSRMVYPLVGQAMRPANIVGNKLFALLFSFLLRQPVKDTLCGTKAVLAANYRRLMDARAWWDDTDRWGDYDWIFGAAKNHLKIVEQPVHYFERTGGETKMVKRLNNALIMLRMCWLAFRRLR